MKTVNPDLLDPEIVYTPGRNGNLIAVGSKETVLGATFERRIQLVERATKDEESFFIFGQGAMSVN